MKPGQDRLEIMTVAQVAEYLQLAEKTVVRMAQRGEIPAAKVASQWRFMLPVIRDWLMSQLHTLPASRTEDVPAWSRGSLPLQDVIRQEYMNLNVRPGPLSQLISPLRETHFLQSAAPLLRSLLEREQMMTTGIGHGVALPHPRKATPGMFPSPAVALGVCPEGADFDAIDDQPVRIFFLVCATTEEIHLQLMAGIAWLIRHDDFMARLRGAAAADEAVAVLRDMKGPHEWTNSKSA